MSDGSAVVLGLGNIIMSDEGVGVHVVRKLVNDSRVPAAARLVDGGTLGLELLSIATGANLLIVVDAVDLDLPPGTIVRLGANDLCSLDPGAGVHQLGVADLLSALRMMGAEPDDVLLLGVQPARVALGTALSPEVEGAVDVLADRVVEELASWRLHGEVLCRA